MDIRTQIEEIEQQLERMPKGTLTYKKIRSILKDNPYLSCRVSTGYQDFYDIMAEGYMYVDKTAFLKEW